MYKKIFALLAMTVFLSGCIKVETDLTINKDGSAIVKDRFMMSKQLLTMANQDPFEQAMKEKSADGREITPYETEEMKGFEAKTVIKNIDTDKWNITPENKAIKTNNADKKFISVKKDFFKTVYNIDAEFDISQSSENPTDAAQLEAMKASGMDINNFMQYKYIIHTPNKPDSHNATYVDEANNVYTWHIKFGDINKMQMKLTVYNTINIVVAVTLLLIIFLGILYSMHRKQ